MSITVSILGCGWLGMPLAEALIARGHNVNGSTTTPAKQAMLESKQINPYLLDLTATDPKHLLDTPFFDCNALVIAIPPKKISNYADAITTLHETLSLRPIPKVLFISSTSVYGDNNHRVDESNPLGPTKPVGYTLLDAEHVLKATENRNTLCLRLGGLVGPGRFPGYFFKGAIPVPNGLAPVNLIHLDDCLAIATKLLENSYPTITINAVCPHHPTRASFYTMAAKAAGQPVPNFIMNKEKNWKIVKSRHLTPLLNYEFMVNNWYHWLARGPYE